MCVFVCVLTVKRETAPTPPPPQTPTKPALTEEELDKKSTAIIEEYLHINDMKVQCCSIPKRTLTKGQLDDLAVPP